MKYVQLRFFQSYYSQRPEKKKKKREKIRWKRELSSRLKKKKIKKNGIRKKDSYAEAKKKKNKKKVGTEFPPAERRKRKKEKERKEKVQDNRIGFAGSVLKQTEAGRIRSGSFAISAEPPSTSKPRL